MAANSLESLGFKSGHDVQHLQRADPHELLAGNFFDQATNLLQKASPIVLEELVPHLEEYEGRWNPGGFMVYPLGVHEVLGSLRFHVYPRGIPRESDQGPNIHNHGWHLISKILVGEYRDTIYNLEDQGVVLGSSSQLQERGLLRLFRTMRNPGGRDVLVTDGTVVRPVPTRHREAQTGDIHTIEANVVYHLTTIPEEQLTATLVLDSPAFTDTTDVLINSASPQLSGVQIESAMTEVARARRLIDHTTTVLAKAQLTSALRERTESGLYLPRGTRVS